MEVRRQVNVAGIVQGVGFRPYVYRLAIDNQLTGTITNTPSGVSIEIQGPHASVANFLQRLPREAPSLARITSVLVSELPINGDREFRIIPSHTGEAVHTLISPDVATCEDCLRELLDPADRRYRYPLINCTNCGPRFTITRNIPYDRPSTSMSVFPMCGACQAEYDDPHSRRFHAQPNACWNCGPRLQLWDRQGRVLEDDDPLNKAVAALTAGRIIVVKGLGGFHLACDATNSAAVSQLRERKRREEKPFAVMVPNAQVAQELCKVSTAEIAVLQSIQRPIVLLRKQLGDVLAEAIAPLNRDFGIFLPYTPLHHLLFAQGKFTALVMTSANLSEEPIAIDNDEARTRLKGIADYFLVHNREILLRCDDSVVRVLHRRTSSRSFLLNEESLNPRERENEHEPPRLLQQLRRSRGFVPVPVFLRDNISPVLAVGGELKNTICLTKENLAFLSQHIGDLENFESYKFFEEAINHLQKVLEMRPEIIAYDLHPDYFSTKWALRQKDVQLVGVQHHHAHIASCMAENHLDGKVIGFALDGTGYGTDGNIWGGEILVASYDDFHRAAYFEYVPMPGGAAAIREPWRMAVSYLFRHFRREFLSFKLPFLREINPKQVDFSLQMIERNVNSPLTSSCGRLFDAVSALTGVRQRVNYEAQAAIELEMALHAPEKETAYPFYLQEEGNSVLIRTRPLFEAIVRDVALQVPLPIVSGRFHNGLIAIFSQIANTLRDSQQLNRVCLSGGTFNNVYLIQNLSRELERAGFEVFMQTEVPTGDGGLSLGQALVAARKTNRARGGDATMPHCYS